MNASAERRDVLAQRTTEMRELIARMDNLDEGTILSSVNPLVAEQLSSQRVWPRLVMRRGRRIAGSGLFAPVVDPREKVLLSNGAGGIEQLCHSVGAHVLWQDVIRLVRRVDSDALNDSLGIPARDIALEARDEAIGVLPMPVSDDSASLAELVKREGALSWACWLAACDPISARRLRVFTPDTVASRIQGGLPSDAEQRKFRRRVVEIEIDRIVAQRPTEILEGQVQ